MTSQQPNFQTPNPDELQHVKAQELVEDGTLDENVETSVSNQDNTTYEGKEDVLDGDSQIIQTNIAAG